MLEPLQAAPVIIEDDCFIGARSEVAEGVIVERGSVLSMGVFLGASTKIVDRMTGAVSYGRVPAYSWWCRGDARQGARRRHAKAGAGLRRDREAGGLPARGPRPPSTNCCAIEPARRPRPLPSSPVSPLCEPAGLAAALIRCPSVTPADAGAQDVLAAHLEQAGFAVVRLRFGAIENLFARIGAGRPHLCFAGHTDVVPPGQAGWSDDPFAGVMRDGVLYGRGACDMKGGVAAFAAAACRHVADGMARGSISLLVTGDEEGDATDGTVRVLEWMRAHDEIPDFCLVGEPTNPGALGEMIKVGRRGSLNATLTIRGVQGHSAYPQRADNPVHRLIRVLADLTATVFDSGTARFEATTLQVTSIDVGNPASNVIPAAATARFNMRFNDAHTGAALHALLRRRIAALAPDFELAVQVSGEAFVTEPALCRRGAGRGDRGGDRAAAGAGYRRRDLRCALHRPRSARWRSSGWSGPACTRPTST